MQIPSRIVYGGRRGTPPALVAATAASVVMFAATPFLLVPVSERFGVSIGMAGGISVAQVGSFAVVNFLFPRLIRPRGTLLRAAAIALVVFNLLSMIPVGFMLLLVLRTFAGVAAGTMTWLAWTSAMTRSTSMASISATGPIVALVAAPVVAVVAGHGDQWVFLVLALVALPSAVLVAPVPGRRRAQGVISASRSNRILLAALGGVTLFGSALFINEAIAAANVHQLDPTAASLAFSLNAAGGLLGARLSVRHRFPGWFLASIGPAALLTVLGPVQFFYIGMAWWGFAFWMGVPGVLRMLVDRSLQPSERAGDAQGVMALGRAGGPALGGAFVDGGSFVGLAVTASIGVTIAGAMIIGVQEGRDRLPPTDPDTLDQQDVN